MAAAAVEIRDLRSGEIPEGIGVLARGMRDNPQHMVAYGPDPAHRLRCHTLAAEALFHTFERPAICALRAGEIVAVAGAAEPGTCQPSPLQGLRLLPRMAAMGPRTAIRVGRWVSDWGRRDPDEPHVHLGPVAVDSHLQGEGIGSELMREHARRLDAAGQVGYLETDKAENVRFYERIGYATVDQAPVLGVPNWFMRRPVGG
jgi:ribosomal protein S18 acetylase RimI-like enzyme